VLLWGSQPLTVDFFGSNAAVTIWTGRIYPAEVALIGIGIAVAVGAELYSTRTMLGIANLATAEDRVAARLRGINVERLSLFAFALAGAICMGLGVFVGPKTAASVDLGDNLAIKGFVALAIGGFGSQKGALAGGMAAGLAEALAARTLGADYQNAAVFLLLLFVLLVRPTGLFGEKEQRVV
jgi:branched-chain amino acid transport system permease protein